MSDFLTEVKGFTPLVEVMVEEVGLVQAAVYGVVWRYCQRRDGVCTASHETLASALGLSRGTVQRHIKELCEAGYLRDTTPDRKNRPHVYADTGRAQIVGLVEAKVTVTERNSTVSEKDSTVSEEYSPLYQRSTQGEHESTQETHDADAPLADPSPPEQEPELVGKPALDAVFGERKTPKAEVVTSTGSWLAHARDAPYLLWGAESAELTRQKLQYGTRAEPVLKLGYELDKALGLRPIWEVPSKVKTWTSGLYACLLAAEWDADLVLATARKMREDKLTIKSPWSIEGMVEAAAAEKRSDGPGGAVFGRLQV